MASATTDIEANIAALGLDPADKKIFSTAQVYKLAGISEDDYSSMTFEKFVPKT